MKNLVLKTKLSEPNGTLKWQILVESDSIEKSKVFLMQCAMDCSFDVVVDSKGNAYDEELEEVIYYSNHLEFIYGGHKYTIVDQDEFNKGFFNCINNAIASDEIKKYFGLDPDELVKTYHLNWGDGEYIGTDLTELIKDIEGNTFDPEQFDNGELEITVVIKKTMTRRQVEELPDFDL